MKNINESGRSMVEMLGVLAIIGVLSIGGIAGYSMAMNRYRANEILDAASKYAVMIYAGAQTYGATHTTGNYTPTDFEEIGLGKLPSGAKSIKVTSTTAGEETTYGGLQGDGVELEITFDSDSVCKAALSILGETSSADGTCSSIKHVFAQS